MAEAGSHAVCIDNNGGKLERLRAGRVPTRKPGLEVRPARNPAEGRVSFTREPYAALEDADTLVTGENSYWSADFGLIRNELKCPAVFASPSIVDPGVLAIFGFQCHSLGRRAGR